MKKLLALSLFYPMLLLGNTGRFQLVIELYPAYLGGAIYTAHAQHLVPISCDDNEALKVEVEESIMCNSLSSEMVASDARSPRPFNESGDDAECNGRIFKLVARTLSESGSEAELKKMMVAQGLLQLGLEGAKPFVLSRHSVPSYIRCVYIGLGKNMQKALKKGIGHEQSDI